MPWCPNCKKEYVGGVSKCPECEATLMEVVPENKAGENLKMSYEDLHLEEKLLFTAENEVEFSLISDALKKEKVPFRTEEDGIWDYFHILSGHSYIGPKVYVSDKDYPKAKDIYDYFMDIKDEFE